jgi:hypothetical protein
MRLWDNSRVVELVGRKALHVGGRHGRRSGLLTKRSGGAHELGWKVKPCIAEVETLAKGRHIVLVGGHILEEGGEEFVVGLAKQRRPRRWFRGVEERFLVCVDGICKTMIGSVNVPRRRAGRRGAGSETYTQRADTDRGEAAKNPSWEPAELRA